MEKKLLSPSFFLLVLTTMDMLMFAKAVMQYRARVSKAKLTTSGFRVEEVSVTSPLMCAIQANMRPWSKLMCISETVPISCLFSEMKLAALSDDNSTDTVTCMTSFTPSACVLNTTVAYNPGEIFINGCDPKICQDAQIKPYDLGNIEGRTCTAPFLNIPYVGCLYLDFTQRSWCQAQSICANMEARLIVPADFTEMQIYLLAVALFQDVWVGVRSRAWLNGNPVTSSQWWPGYPSGAATDCGKMTFGFSGLLPTYKVKDESCYTPHAVACYRPNAPVCQLSLLQCAALMLG
ncbi:uncharacterized protein LOC135204494 [Macrobrachium nipponense]|uniref:uncharacterized protein LOC135204494 n=1 Tax=Macrobrachium nipponense TaxID=159736 RepID=UPI0030C8C9E3